VAASVPLTAAGLKSEKPAEAGFAWERLVCRRPRLLPAGQAQKVVLVAR